jgi:O-antigen ligase
MVGAFFVAAAFAGAALAYDTNADASFDAPKRLLSVIAIAAAALSTFGFMDAEWKNPFSGRVRLSGWTDRRLAPALVGAALILALVSALASPHRALALDSLRVAAAIALLLPLGASVAVGRRAPFLLGAFLAATSVDALVSILQARGIYHPFSLVTQTAREATGAFAGNVGYLALALAIAAGASLALALVARRIAVRIAGAVLVLLFGTALLVDQNLTAWTALAAGVAVLFFGLFGRKAVLPFAGAILAAALAIGLYAPMRQRAVEGVAAARAGEWDRLLSYRTAPWAAAVEMARDRPLLGFGPGTFGAEFVTHRLRADIAARHRLVSPLAASTYGEAHCDYLQPFAELGVPAALAILAAGILVVAGLARLSRSATGEARNEAVMLLAVLAVGATAALTWFPFQRPITAIPLLFAAGLAWRRTADARMPEGSAAE